VGRDISLSRHKTEIKQFYFISFIWDCATGIKTQPCPLCLWWLGPTQVTDDAWCRQAQWYVSLNLSNRSLVRPLYLSAVHRVRSSYPRLLRVLDVQTTLHRCSVSYTGYRYASASASRLWRSFIGRCLAYLADDCRLVADARERRLRSTASRTCVVTRTYSTFGDRAFAAAGPGLWNSVASHVKRGGLIIQ